MVEHIEYYKSHFDKWLVFGAISVRYRSPGHSAREWWMADWFCSIRLIVGIHASPWAWIVIVDIVSFSIKWYWISNLDFPVKGIWILAQHRSMLWTDCLWFYDQKKLTSMMSQSCTCLVVYLHSNPAAKRCSRSYSSFIESCGDSNASGLIVRVLNFHCFIVNWIKIRLDSEKWLARVRYRL